MMDDKLLKEFQEFLKYRAQFQDQPKQVLETVDMATGYWSEHEYQRHSVERDVALSGFIGWAKFAEILGAADSEKKRNLVVATFKEGGRINEVLKSRHDNFRVVESPEDGQEYLLCEALPLSKRWKKVGMELVNGKARMKTVHVEAFRTFALPLKDSIEPYSEEFSKFVLSKSRGLLFPSPYKSKKGEPLSTTRAYQIVHQEIGVEGNIDIWLYNHLIRAWRASQLRRERKFTPFDLMEFFMWRDMKTALIYAKEGVWGIAGKGLTRT